MSKAQSDDKKPKSEPIKDFNLIKWNKRKVTIFFDGDKWDKWNVLHAEALLWKHLKSIHSNCKVANITKQFYECTKAKGIDDILALPELNSKEILQQLLSRATTIPPGFAALKNEEDVEYDEIAYNTAKYLIEDYIFIGLKRGVFSFQKGYYKLIEDAHFIKHETIKLLEQARYTPSTHILSDISKLIPSICRTPETKVNPENMHNVKNGILKLNVEDGLIEFIEHNTSIIFTSRAEAKYSPNQDCMQTQKFLDEIMPDKKHQKLYLEALAFAIFPALRQLMEYTKMIAMFGEGANGKTVLIGFCMRLIGYDACGTTSLDQINSGDKFQISSLYQKRANFCSENEATIIKETKILKSITSGKDGDMLDVEFKFVNPFKAKINPIMFFAVNKELSIPADGTPALLRRLVFVDFSYKFVDNPEPGTNERKKDNRLESKNYTQAIVDGLLYLTVEAAKDLIKRGKPFDEGVNEGVREAILRGSHLERFIETNIELSPAEKVESNKVWERYLDFDENECLLQRIVKSNDKIDLVWHDEKYDKTAKRADGLTKKLLKHFKGKIKVGFTIDFLGNKQRAIVGIRLKERHEDIKSEMVYQGNSPPDLDCTPERQNGEHNRRDSNDKNISGSTQVNSTQAINSNQLAYRCTDTENTELEKGTPTDSGTPNGVPENNLSKPTVPGKGSTLLNLTEENTEIARKAIKDSYKKVFGKDFNE